MVGRWMPVRRAISVTLRPSGPGPGAAGTANPRRNVRGPAAAASLSCMQLSENFGGYHQLAKTGQGKTIVRCVDSTLMCRPCIAENSLFKNSNRPADGQTLHGDIMIPGHKPGLRRLAATLLTAAAGVFASGALGGLSGQACPHRGRLFRRRHHRRDRPHHGQGTDREPGPVLQMVENKPGAGSNIATDQGATRGRRTATLLFVAVTSAINQTLYKTSTST